MPCVAANTHTDDWAGIRCFEGLTWKLQKISVHECHISTFNSCRTMRNARNIILVAFDSERFTLAVQKPDSEEAVARATLFAGIIWGGRGTKWQRIKRDKHDVAGHKLHEEIRTKTQGNQSYGIDASTMVQKSTGQKCRRAVAIKTLKWFRISAYFLIYLGFLRVKETWTLRLYYKLSSSHIRNGVLHTNLFKCCHGVPLCFWERKRFYGAGHDGRGIQQAEISFTF